MEHIQIRNNCILYYGNTVGYLSEKKAVIDPMFATDELRSYLSEKKIGAEWSPGTFERLAAGTVDTEGNMQMMKRCRVWQLAPEANIMMKFIGYDEFVKRFGEPDLADYQIVYDGETETNDLEALYTKFNTNHPPGYEGHSLSMSDVLELYDSDGSTFYYCDRFGFQKIPFQESGQEQVHDLQMGLSL